MVPKMPLRPYTEAFGDAVAMSLHGYIAGPQGEADWIEMDPAVDVAAFFRESTPSSTSRSWEEKPMNWWAVHSKG